MNKNDTMKWEDIYKVWKWEMCKFPVLSAQKYCLKTEISKPRFGLLESDRNSHPKTSRINQSESDRNSQS